MKQILVLGNKLNKKTPMKFTIRKFQIETNRLSDIFAFRAGKTPDPGRFLSGKIMSSIGQVVVSFASGQI